MGSPGESGHTTAAREEMEEGTQNASDPSMEGESGASSRPRRLFWRLRQRWKLLGLFEIDKEHEFYPLTLDLKEGLREAVQDAIRSDAKASLTDDDYRAKLTQAHEGFVMRTYAGPVFSQFRHSLGLSEESYQRSLASCSCYLQFISNSKSKADFFLTNDKRFFLKTQSKREAHFMLEILQKYMQHFQAYPHSLLVKILGVYSITRAQEKKKYFIIMQSVFFPDERIIGRYDIKGCTVSRWTEPEPEGSRLLQVFKDQNFEGNVVCVDQQRSWLMRQAELDTHFLQGLNVLDYSLLVGFQPLHADEKNQSWSLANLIVRTKRSVNGTGSPTTSNCASVPGTVDEEQESVEEDEFSRTSDLGAGGRILMRKIGAQVSITSDVSDVVAQNRRLLPNYKNPLHVMDGPELRYFIGIIDIFTVYSLKKRLEHFWKSIRFRGQEFSTVSPTRYSQRLCRWVETHTV
ncbi:LOW QUALITY PROTEIN: phosphatidylinositol 4-phosphate 5-kinase-like protein 1 [Bombina bombina]|uniref:LOW QUALITY PROTEIN: phosphatidylinositol 4-phosphate 5-kinase-like protein 1 n=1 Tax=Bombina bombina TaxID=8345 RepID=UPI00235A6C7D|nr:LOW QUALITY PROTEIN: phosphatidylinositol 4-phosphate 5-kinase-like protein 1 [Bombina bombina]